MTSAGEHALAVHPAIDWDRAAATIAATGRTRIANFLTEPSARRLHQNLASREDWRHVIGSGGKAFEIPDTAYAALAVDTRTTLETTLHREATSSFRYRYDTIRVPEATPSFGVAGDPLRQFAALMNGAAMLDRVRTLIGDDSVALADAQATRYRPGHFLNRHDDAVAGKHRRAAYVMGLSRGWRAEWGGALAFLDDAGDIAEARNPGFNTLDLFLVPSNHFVACVAPYAGEDRLAITGWLRASGAP